MSAAHTPEQWKVAVETDGHRSYRARCLECGWTSKWFERGSQTLRQELALAAAKEHGDNHAATYMPRAAIELAAAVVRS